MAFADRFRSTLSRVQWLRGARAGIAVASIMVGCRVFGRPTGWAALGVLLVLNVDNGGPYRSRLGNIATVIFGSILALYLGIVCTASLPVAVVVTALFCFAVTLARVVSQPLASASVSILVCYIVTYGGSNHTPAYALNAIGYFVAGGLWAGSFALVFWPVDPFGPARNAVADLYARLAGFAADVNAANDHVAQVRLLIETAQSAVAATPARMTARTVRARNLAALVQTADLLFARILRIAELGGHDSAAHAELAHTHVADLSRWLASFLSPVALALRQRPLDSADAFAAEGSLSIDMQRSAQRVEGSNLTGSRDEISTQLDAQFAAVQRDCLLSLEVVYESVRAIWTGSEPRATRAAALRSSLVLNPEAAPSSMQVWAEALRANLTTNSVMFRHALRLATVTSADLLLLHVIPITHSYWLPMTSIIVLQPYTGETWRRSGDRVGGTVAGAAVAAILAATIASDGGIIAAISIGSFLSLAVYAADYAWYSFFLTPTIVLLTLPHLRDWHFAAVRMGMTGLGALTALLAMLLLWPERESVQLPRLLARAAAADAAYLRAMLKFWQCSAGDLQARTLTERTILAPARRACGLANNDAEDSLDRALLEHSIPLRSSAAQERLNHDALTFTSYVRRLAQSITTLAAIGAESAQLTDTVSNLAARLDTVAGSLFTHHATPAHIPEAALTTRFRPTLADQQMARIERQVAVLEHAAADIASS